MPQFLLFAAVGAGLYAGYRLVQKMGEDVVDAMARAEHEIRQRASSGQPKDLGRLEFDPRTGEYRPSRHI
ncbi:MAG TPA: hypothetical protein PK970_03080 [Hyphomicrobiaceae bacterium]|nr:hypothetical protein [Hyphomicrobiaceae bacterium]